MRSYIDVTDTTCNPCTGNAWWQVDLGASRPLQKVLLWNVDSGSNYRNNYLHVCRSIRLPPE